MSSGEGGLARLTQSTAVGVVPESARAPAPTSQPTSPRIEITATITDQGRTDVVVTCGASRIEMSFWQGAPMPVDAVDRELMEMVVARFLLSGVSRGRIRSTAGRLVVYALARHIRFAMETEALTADFAGLPVTKVLPSTKRWLAGITLVHIT